VKIILGGPGCGKTHYLLETVEQELASGVRPDQIAYVAFTRKAAHEAKERAMHKFELAEEDLPFFRTLHSFAFKQLALATTQVMSDKDYATIGKAIDKRFSKVDPETGLLVGDSEDDRVCYLEQMSRLLMKPLKETCEQFIAEKYWEVKYYADALDEYKRGRHVYDFTDMLEIFADRGECPTFKVVVIDEAQDLSPLQWRVVDRITRGAERVYIAGDDDQAIYEWSGADVQTFLNLRGDVHVLPTSHRLPRLIFDKSHEIVQQIKNRYSKKWDPASEGGTISRYSSVEQVDFSEGTWYLLARNRYMLSSMVDALRAKGFPYVYNGKSSTQNDTVKAILAWESLRKGEARPFSDVKLLASKFRHGATTEGTAKILAGLDADRHYVLSDLQKQFTLDASEDWMSALRITDKDREYYRAIRRRNESLVKWPRILVSTIHQVKGGEADHVFLKRDMSWRCYQNLTTNPDSEHRVFYVGATRARKSLHVLHPQTNKAYKI
jgi:superfamily I DNA/RNA helicase